MTEKVERKHPRQTQVIIPAIDVEKVAEMFKGTSFSEAVTTCAIYGINQLYEAHLTEQKEKVKEAVNVQP